MLQVVIFHSIISVSITYRAAPSLEHELQNEMITDDSIVAVFLPGGGSRAFHRQEVSVNLDEIESDVFAPSATRRIGDSDWYIRVPYYRPDGIFAFELTDEGAMRQSEWPPVYSCLLCASSELAREYWKVAMLINPNRVPMPKATPWISVFVSESIGPLTGARVSQLDKILAQVAWAAMQRFAAQSV